MCAAYNWRRRASINPTRQICLIANSLVISISLHLLEQLQSFCTMPARATKFPPLGRAPRCLPFSKRQIGKLLIG